MKLLRLFRNVGSADVQAIGALLGAGLTYLLLRVKTTDVYNGLELKKDHGWKRVEEAIRLLAGLAFTGTAEGPGSSSRERSSDC